MEKTLDLPENLNLKAYQAYLREMVVARGFDHETVQDTFVILMEEIGELAKAARKATGMMVESGANYGQVADELADCLNLLGCLANLLNVDLEEALRAKEAKNSQRTWRPAESSKN